MPPPGVRKVLLHVNVLSGLHSEEHTTHSISAVCNMYILLSHLHILLKIVLSTNIAETGVTIPDVVFVIDTGKTKENRWASPEHIWYSIYLQYDGFECQRLSCVCGVRYHESSQMSSLVETFVSKASALQRQGRAGRVRGGFCFRLYPKFRYNATEVLYRLWPIEHQCFILFGDIQPKILSG